MNASSFGPLMSSSSHAVGGTMGAGHDRDDAASVSSRQVHIPTMSHSAMNGSKHSSESAQSDSGSAGSGLPYGLPSASNGLPMEQEEAALPEARKVSGLRAALVNKFAAKKKSKEFRTSAAVSTKRQQHQLESLMTQSAGGLGDSAAGPRVGGQPVGHPMSFQHVEHLSPTQIAPKMPLINNFPGESRAPVSSAKPANSERRLNFRNFKPASLLTKPSKLSIGSSSSNEAKKGPVTLRGKPIGAPSGFQHVDHLSPDEYSMQQFHLLNHRQQQNEIVSVLRQNSQAADESRKQAAPRPDRPEKITFRGLPVSGPVSFDHVEHVSPREYKQHLEETMRKSTVAVATANVDTLLPDKPDTASTAESAADDESAVDAQSSARSSADRPCIAALQHTSETLRSSSSDSGVGKSGKMPSSAIQELQAKAKESSEGPPKGLLAKAGISKVRQISSPFNVQHDVHISVEDLDDIMQQVPENWKAYISPKGSPLSGHQDTGDSYDKPTTPIFEEMTSRRRRSTGNDDVLASQMARTKLGTATSDSPGTPGWLPHIVSVSSPANLTPQGLRKQRTVSGHSASVLDSALTSRPAGRASSADLTAPRAPTPVSAPIRANSEEDGQAAESPDGLIGEAPATPQSAAHHIDDARRSWDNNVSPEPPTTDRSAADGPQAKWIKRKSRVMSTLGVATIGKGISKITVPVPTLTATNDKRHTLSPDSMDAAAKAKAAAIARLEMNSTVPIATGSLPPTNPFHAASSAPAETTEPSGQSSTSKSRPSTSGKSSKKRRENYGELEEYAEGESGSVYLAPRKAVPGKRSRGDYVAIKVVPKSAKTRYRKLRTELRILRRIRSQHVVRFYEHFSIDDSVWLVYEFMGRGSITDLLAGYPEIRMPAVTISYTMHEVLTALAYLHERHIVHCDVRSDNVLIDDRGFVKLADFSSAVYLKPDQQSAQKPTLGAIYWMAPELAKGAGYSATTDVWAAGALLYEMLEGQPPYIEYPDIKVLELANANGMPKLSSPDSCDASLVELMRQCTATSPSERPPASRLRKHESVLSQDSSQCAQLMIDFVLQVESLEDQEDLETD
ncbi:hypothetical protein IWW36_000209 [Coemansia brasiliensis]|uniref:Non-specific serine/threonine protein kinase n=1 Tax=Coemansia brasiliensis TaxID=2650707 RepID=A0A9W8IBM8_9FUNG|nr:hypothetical protein IWW36_000209 [Coemansia brasiliensis]